MCKTTARIQNERPGVHHQRQIDEARVANFKVRYRHRRQRGHVRIGAVGYSHRTEFIRLDYRSPDAAVPGIIHQQVRQQFARGLGVDRTGPAVGPAAAALRLQHAGEAGHVVVVQRDPTTAAATAVSPDGIAAIGRENPGPANRRGRHVHTAARAATAGLIAVTGRVSAVGTDRTVHHQPAAHVQPHRTTARSADQPAVSCPAAAAAQVHRLADGTVTRATGRTAIPTAAFTTVPATAGIV